MKIFPLDALFEFSPGGGGKSTCGPAPIVSVARTLSEITNEIEACAMLRAHGRREAGSPPDWCLLAFDGAFSWRVQVGLDCE